MLAVCGPLVCAAFSDLATPIVDSAQRLSRYCINAGKIKTNLSILEPSSGELGQSMEKEHIRLLQSKMKMNSLLATKIIQRTWRGYRNKQLFRLLKHTICAAEHSMTHDVLRKLKPLEHEILKDSSMRFKVKFRFAGQEFPPILVFKIFQHNMTYKSHYFSGKSVIRPATEAAADSCKVMGHRKFYDLLIDDELQFQRFKIADEVDVITMKDYMQYQSHLDETPAHLGGRDNNWRILSMDNLPRSTLLFDVAEYAQSRILSPRLKKELPILLSLPTSQDIQLQHIKALSRIRSSSPAISVSMRKESKTPNNSQRRSHKALLKFNKMRKIYGLDYKKEDESIEATHGAASDHPRTVTISTLNKRYSVPNTASDEEWEKEVDKLYAWTQELSFEF